MQHYVIKCVSNPISSSKHNSLLVTTIKFSERDTGHDQLQGFDHTVEAKVTNGIIKKSNLDKEKLNGLYNSPQTHLIKI